MVFARLAFVLSLGLAAAVGAGCSSSVPVGTVSVDGTYVGAVTGSDYWVATYANGNQVAVYVCGGATSFGTASRWYLGNLTARRAVLTADGWTVAVDLAEGHATGTITPPSAAAIAFDAPAARASSLEGLYVALDDGRRTGVIVRHEPGKDPVAQGTWFGPSFDARAQVTPIKPIDATTFDVQFTFGGQTRNLTVKPFTF